MDIQVIKRDGSVEDFDQEKIERVVKAAGLDQEEAVDLAERVAEWAKSTKKEEITSLELRDKVVDELTETDEYAANMFVWYQKTKDKTGYAEDPTLEE